MRLQRVPRDRVVQATSTAAVASAGTGGGRLIPLIMIDATEHPEIAELIRVHEHTPAGDCVSQWSTAIANDDVVGLRLEFQRPVATEFLIQFELPKLAGAVDNILRAKSMYLLEGAVGSRYSTTENAPRILIELPHTGFEPVWNRIFRKSIIKMHREEGLKPGLARSAADKFIADWRARSTFNL